MAFSIDHGGPPRRAFFYTARRRSDGRHWDASSATWAEHAAHNGLAEVAPGRYSAWLKATAAGETYEVEVRPRGGPVVRAYVCDARGRPPRPPRRARVTLTGGVLRVDGAAQVAAVVLEEPAPAGRGKYTATLWKPSNIASCNCPDWTSASDREGRPLEERSCPHARKVAGMTSSVYLDSPNLPPTASAPAGRRPRPGRGIELD